jgi:hypothetical protein
MRTITVILVIWQLDANFACDTSQVAASMRARMTSFNSRFGTFWLRCAAVIRGNECRLVHYTSPDVLGKNQKSLLPSRAVAD